MNKLTEYLIKPFLEDEVIEEGINDPGILKAVFLAGGPGSGKSFVAGEIYGIPDNVNVSAYGLKLVNQDKELERMLKKYGFGLDLDDMPEELFRQLTDPKYDDYSGMRGRAKELTASRKKLYMDGRLGMIIDGTGHKFKKIKEQKKELEEIGYDTYMVFVHTELEVAQKRNMERPRKLDPELVEKSWREVQANKIYFQGLFGGSNFIMVDNSNHLSPKQATKKFNMLVKKGIGNFIRKPVKNYRGKNWIKKQKILQKEDVDLPVNVGDTIMMGRFKNKKVVVKDISWNEKGDLLINGRPALKFRIVKEGLPTKIKQLRKIKKVKAEPDSAKGTYKSTATFNTHHAGSMGAGDMGKISEPDTYDWDDSGSEPNPGGHQTKKNKKKKGYEPVEEQKQIKKTIGVFGGRFQPFHSGHLATYKWLAKQVDEAYITTSNIKQPPRHPMNFKEKVRHMVKMGIPKNRIVQEKTPYVAQNLLKKFNADTTAVVYAFGQKDAGRLGSGKKKSGGLSYYQDYKKSKGNIKGYEEHGYFLTAPQQGSMSGTKMRDLLGNPKHDDSARQKTFKKAFGYFDKGVYNMMTNKFRKLFETYTLSDDLIKEYLVEATVSSMGNLDDGPSTFHKDYAEYVKVSKEWIDSIYADAGWAVLDYIIRDGAKNSIKDAYKSVPLTFLDHGNEKGSNRAVNKYKKWMSDVIEPLGWDVVSWMGTSAAIDNLIGSVMTAGADGDSYLPNEFQVVETFSKEWWKNKLMLGEAFVGVTKDGDKRYYDDQDSLDKAIEKGSVKPVDKKDKDDEKKSGGKKLSGGDFERDSEEKPKSKPKIKVPKIPIPKIKIPKFKIKAPTISPEKLEKRRKEVERARNRPDRKPNVVDGVDVIRDKEDEKHFIDDFLLKGDRGVDKEEYDGKMRDQWEEQQKKRTPAERKQIKKDVASWKQLGGFEAIQDAIENGDITEEEIRERNERISEVSHTTITKVDRPIERGISVPNDVAEQILADFEEGEMVEIPDESGHGSSGFSTSAETARSFAGVDNDNPEQTSIVFRIEPNSNGEVRGAFIDGEPDESREDGYWGEGEITRSSKSKAKVKKVERTRLPNGKVVVTVTLQEPDDLSEIVVKEQKGKVNMISKKYLEGPLNPKPKKKNVKEDIKPDVINSFILRDSLNKKIWKDGKIKPEIRKKLLVIAKNFFDGLDLDSDVDLKDITLTGSISNYNWSKFSDVDLHLRLDFSQIDDDEEFVKNYFLAKKTIWNNEHDISIFGFPVEMYVENLGDVHIASGLYSILKDEWIVKPKKKELKIDLDDITSKAEGYLGSVSVLKDMMKKGKYDEVIKMVDKIKDRLKRMRSSGLAKGGEFSVENLAFKALRRSPFIATISDMKTDAYDKKMSMKERISIVNEVKLLVEGGAYGHLNHPFDNKNLTFSDFKTLIINTLQGNLDKEGPVTEKTDGQNIMISWKNGKLVAARNKGHIKNFGANSLDISGIRNMFSGRGDIEKAFVSAMTDLQKALKGLSKKQKDKIFAEGKKFMSLEVMYPATSNVIPYDKSLLQFHGTIEYDSAGSPIGEDRGSARMLAGMIKQINQNVQKTYSITKPFITQLPVVKNFAQRQSYFLGKLQKLQSIYKLTDSATLGDYHQAYWMEYIYNGAKQTDNPNPSNDVLMKLTKRWAFFDKSYKIPQIRKDLKEYPKFLDWVLSTDKMDHAKLQKKHIRDWEVLFFELGAEILKNMKDFIAANPTKAAQQIRKDLTKAINQVKKSKDPKVLSTLKTQLDRLNAIGGLKAVVPTEGITFVFKGKLYKYTGAFAPANQILGMLKFV